MWSLHVFSRYSGFLPQSRDMHVRLIGGFKLPVGVIVSVHGCSSAMDWRPVQGVPPPEEIWDRLQQIPVTLYRTKWVWMMYGCLQHSRGRSTLQILCYKSSKITNRYSHSVSRSPCLSVIYTIGFHKIEACSFLLHCARACPQNAALSNVPLTHISICFHFSASIHISFSLDLIHVLL